MKKKTTKLTIIKTSEQLQSCINNSIKVGIWINERQDCESNIISFTDNVVIFEVGRYLKSNCTFRIEGYHLRLIK